ncbi:Acyl-CoA N-acyltransferase [Apiospora sp. TS-2023a]
MTVAPEILHHSPAGFHIREATKDDVENLTSLWYSSFNPSHPFWDVATPDDAVSRRWWNDTWTMGLQAGPDVLRTFVVEDHAQGGRLAAVARWHVPQDDGCQDIPLPEFPAKWDTEVTETLWGGMPRNRREIMGQRSHWMLEFLGVDQGYQGKGLGFALLDWGCRQADKVGLEVYLDATIKGLPFYKKCCGFEERKPLVMPVRPDTYGNYELVASVRMPRPQTVKDE